MSTIQDKIASYMAADAARAEAQGRADAIGLAALVANEGRIRDALLKEMVPDYPYPWGDGCVLVRRRGIFRDRAVVLPAAGPTAAPGVSPSPLPIAAPSPLPAAAPSPLLAALGSTARFVLAVTASTFVVSGGWKDVHVPDIPNPFVKSPAYTAGVAMDKGLAGRLADSFRQAAADIQAGKGIAAAQAAHVGRLPAIVKLPPTDPIVAVLDAIVPPTQPTTPTDAQVALYAQALADLAAGLDSRAK